MCSENGWVSKKGSAHVCNGVVQGACFRCCAAGLIHRVPFVSRGSELALEWYVVRSHVRDLITINIHYFFKLR